MKKLVVNGYKYEELPNSTKSKLKQKMSEDLQYTFNDDFQFNINYILEHDLCQQKLRIDYSLSYCQGDGLRLTGELDLIRCLEYDEIKKKFTEKELKRLYHYIINFLETIEIKNNSRYTFFNKNDYDFANELLINLEIAKYKNVDIDLVCRFQFAITNFFQKICSDWEKQGYDYIYPDATEKEIKEYYDKYYFDEFGRTIYGIVQEIELESI